MRKTIAIAFSDLHIHKFNQFNEGNSRLKWTLKALKRIADEAYEKKVPILFGGDFYHSQKELENETIALSVLSYYKYIQKRKIPFYGISGNHDLSERNSLTSESPSHLNHLLAFSSFHLLQERQSYELSPGYNIYGIPYMDNDHDTYLSIKKITKEARAGAKGKDRKGGAKKILLLHQDLPGAVTPSGFGAREYNALNQNLDEFFKDWDLVLCGHIHKPQWLAKNVIMMGSPIHQISSDAGTDMGYWEIVETKGKVVGLFRPLNADFPCFVKEGDKKYNPKKDYLIKKEAAVVQKEVKNKDFHVSNSKKKLAESYLAQKSIKSKAKRRALIKIL